MDWSELTAKKKEIDSYRPLKEELVRNLEEWFRVELTYTSNAIEGNTLTRRETALVVEKGLTVRGKSLVEHLEVTNHAQALSWIKEQVARRPQDISEDDILHLHRLVLKGIDDSQAGFYRNVSVRISGSNVVLPNPLKVPDLMAEFAHWLKQADGLPAAALAAEAHYRLVTIHPFADGNGRTARLLMNMILLLEGYPAAIIRKEDRLKYIGALEKAQLGGTKDDYTRLIVKSMIRSCNIYLKAIKGESAAPVSGGDLLKIGALARQVGENNSTLRHWTKEGLLEVADVTESGYQLYQPEMVERVRLIKKLKQERWTLAEIKNKLPPSGPDA